ncbi:MAG: sigma 54-interacting transcriptional regulator [Methylococcales bacterium]|nr:sigma 54-interacting transcriptional regulator [Methylococcales bacterium]MDD5753916.1 sigma 54-interacting transcriptional regulator [Methylococcales bacterium]
MDFQISNRVKLSHETLLLRHTVEFEVDRPIQAWQWMNQTRTVPEHGDWVRPEVSEAWQRCLEDYQLPLGNYANWDNYPIITHTTNSTPQSHRIENLVKQLHQNFHIFLKESDVMMILTGANGDLLYLMGEKPLSSAFMSRMQSKGANWLESALGNNGIGTAIELKKPIAFQGMEHFLNVLHPFTTVGYPLFDNAGELIAVIGLISDKQENMNSLFAFLHLICVLVNTDFPLAKNTLAQQCVLKQIPLKPAKKSLEFVNGEVSETLALLVKKAVKLQQYKVPILITGESGVGKDHFVRLIRNAGPRKNAPLIAINCASIPHDLIESELFGYESGSFTGARSTGKPGKFMLADKGILFLDEIGDMSFDLQSTLLRVLETSEITPVGGTKSILVDVQVVAATNVHLLTAVEQGRFRRDLYYRLNGCTCHLLPLRERPDKKSIIQHILQRELNAIAPDGEIQICSEVHRLMEQHPWPGNIRQVINVIRATLYTASSSIIDVHDLPVDFFTELEQFSLSNVDSTNSILVAPSSMVNSPVMSLTDWELHGIKMALKDCDGNISMAAKNLGITRTTLYKKIDRFGLNKNGASL